jgi:hypothetical protein
LAGTSGSIRREHKRFLKENTRIIRETGLDKGIGYFGENYGWAWRLDCDVDRAFSRQLGGRKIKDFLVILLGLVELSEETRSDRFCLVGAEGPEK